MANLSKLDDTLDFLGEELETSRKDQTQSKIGTKNENCYKIIVGRIVGSSSECKKFLSTPESLEHY